MSKKLYSKIDENLLDTSNMISGALDLTEVPDEHPVRDRVSSALRVLAESLSSLSTIGRKANLLREEGPMIFVDPTSDMRNWPTSDGSRAGNLIGERSSAHVRVAACTTKPLMMPKTLKISDRRVISVKEYRKYIEDSIRERFEEE